MNDSWQAYAVTYLHQKEGSGTETACRLVSQPSESWPWKRPIHLLLLSFPLSYIFWKLHQRGSGLPRGGSLPWCNSAVSTVTPQPIPLLADDGPPQWVPIIHSCFRCPQNWRTLLTVQFLCRRQGLFFLSFRLRSMRSSLSGHFLSLFLGEYPGLTRPIPTVIVCFIL